ncbi:MAG: DUF4013 domain-containing protein [Halobaculum sp.]
MFEAAVRYPYDEGDGLRAIAIGSVLTLLGGLVIPTILVTGYALRTIRAVADGETHPPVWDEWGALFVDGLRGTAVTVAYFLLPSVLFLGSVGLAFVPFVGGSPRAFGLIAVVVALVSLPLFLVAAYVAPAALVGVAVTDRLGAAVAFGRLWTVVTTADYAVAWVSAVVLTLGASFLTGILTGLTVVGGLFGAVFSFYALVAAAYLYAHGVDMTRFVGGRAAPTVGDDTTGSH